MIWRLAAHTLKEALHKRVMLIALFVGLLCISITPAISVLSVRNERSILFGLTFGIIQLTLVAVGLIQGASLYPEERSRRTLDLILTKPLQRWHYYLGKQIGAFLTLGIIALVMALTFVAMLFLFQQKLSLYEVFKTLKVPAMYWVQSCIMMSLAFFFSTFITPIVNFFLSGCIFLIGSTLNPLIESLSENKTPSFSTALLQKIQLVLPNFSNYNIQNPVLHPEQVIQNDTFYVFNILGYACAYIVCLTIGGMLVLDHADL